MPYVWYCCQCKDGPYNYTLVGRCHCSQHDKCGFCTVEATAAEKTEYGNSPIRMAPCEGINALPLPAFNLNSVDEGLPNAMPDDDPLALPSLYDPRPYIHASTNASDVTFGPKFAGTIRHHGHQDQSYHALCSSGIRNDNHDHYGGFGQQQAPTDGGRDYYWTCCSCGHMNNYNLHDGCSYCNNHWRDRCCKITEVQSK